MTKKAKLIGMICSVFSSFEKEEIEFDKQMVFSNKYNENIKLISIILDTDESVCVKGSHYTSDVLSTNETFLFDLSSLSLEALKYIYKFLVEKSLDTLEEDYVSDFDKVMDYCVKNDITFYDLIMKCYGPDKTDKIMCDMVEFVNDRK